MKTFVEIGSCDFDTLAYLSDYGWRGVIVEPHPTYFQNIPLKDNVHYINAAVDWVDGIRKMWTAPEDVVVEDSDYKGMSTFLEEGNPSLTKIITVPTICFDTLFKMTDVTDIDYLKIDVEGYDYEILKMFPWDRYRPKNVKFESEHLEDDSALQLLKNMGYHCEVDEHNTYAIKL